MSCYTEPGTCVSALMFRMHMQSPPAQHTSPLMLVYCVPALLHAIDPCCYTANSRMLLLPSAALRLLDHCRGSSILTLSQNSDPPQIADDTLCCSPNPPIFVKQVSVAMCQQYETISR